METIDYYIERMQALNKRRAFLKEEVFLFKMKYYAMFLDLVIDKELDEIL